MKLTKNLLALALTVCLLILGAMLPKIVGAVQAGMEAQPGFGEIQAVELKLDEPLSLMDKLHILGRGQYYAFSGDTVLSEQEMPEVVETALEPYYYRELVPYDWKNVDISAQAWLLYLPKEPEVNYVIWIVTLRGSDWVVELQVDDETGKALLVTCQMGTAQEQYTAEAYTELCKEAWFESLGLSDAQWYADNPGTTGNTTSICCYCPGDYERMVAMEFTTYPYGFWTFVSGIEELAD